MTKELNVRNEILRATHQWPFILLFCFLGAALGWGASFALPSPYQASAELYVGLNTYRALQDRNVVEHANGQPFNTPDDYKNWQMANLNTIVLMDGLIKETLDQLRLQDPHWQSIQKDELKGMLHVYWRNAGRWRLVAKDRNPEYAEQAALAWREVILLHLDKAVSNAQDTLITDIEIQNLALEQAALSSRLAQLQNVKTLVQDWHQSQSEETSGQPIPEAAHWQLWSTIGEIAQTNDAWGSLIDAFPAEQSSPTEYFSWIDRVNIQIESSIRSVEAQIENLEDEQEALAKQYALAAKRSLGLSPALIVESSSDSVKLTLMRPTGQMILIGFALGLLSWMLIWLIQLALKNNL